jgi:hypothetical protein
MRAWVAWHPPTERSSGATALVYPATVMLSIEALSIGSVSSQAFIHQRIGHTYRWHRPTPLSSRAAQSRHQLQRGVDGFDDSRAVNRLKAFGLEACGLAMGPGSRELGWTTPRQFAPGA